MLRQCVWFNLSVHLVSRGLEFHHQLRKDSFNFLFDDDDKEYVVLRHETQQKNFQGGFSSDEAPSDKRIYAVPECPTCPVKMLRLLLSKTDQHATNLFNACVKDALISPSSCDTWYLTSLSKSNHSEDLCGIYANLRNAKSVLYILPTV